MEIYHTVNCLRSYMSSSYPVITIFNIDTNPRTTLGLTGMLRRQVHNNKQAKMGQQFILVGIVEDRICDIFHSTDCRCWYGQKSRKFSDIKDICAALVPVYYGQYNVMILVYNRTHAGYCWILCTAPIPEQKIEKMELFPVSNKLFLVLNMTKVLLLENNREL